MKLKKEFDVYLANLGVLTIKLHNLHWNVEGSHFMSVHLLTEGEYEKSFERMDQVAEHAKMFGVIPVSTAKEFLEIADIKEVESKKFGCNEALEILLSDLETMRKSATDLRNKCDKEGWFSAVSMLEDHITDYNKQIWFVKATLAK